MNYWNLELDLSRAIRFYPDKRVSAFDLAGKLQFSASKTVVLQGVQKIGK